MSATLKYVLYLGFLHLLLGGLAWKAFSGNTPYLIGAEILLLVSVYLAHRLYRSQVAPLRLLARGAAALEDQDFSVKLMPTGSRQMDGIVAVYNRMIDQLRQERIGSRQREEFLDRLVDAAELGVVVLNFDGKVDTLNTWTEAKCKDEAFRTAVLNPALNLRPRPALLASGATDGRRPNPAHQAILTGPGGRRYRAEAASFVDRGFERTFLVIQDVTSELLAAEKEAYGKVIRMMAHEVNNSNAAVVSVLKTLFEAAAENDPELPQLNRDYLPVVINRAENMTSFMRNFARVIRLPPAELKRTDLNELLLRTGEVMAPVLAESAIELRYQLAPGQLWIDADASHLEQVVVNALTNARESIGYDGTIRISTTASPTGFVIADDGPGIDPEVSERLFTPFFSTKADGQGVGLTLSRDILDAHGATYELRTEADGWTRFRVQL